MAIQDFVTGQVLTSTQMDNLQANDYNQTVSAKVASYVLVAADKGTRVTMSNAGATTITVNTSLFAAGDTLFITNIGAGACTITAGTATVSTASSLVLAQYDSGRLYFTSTGVAIWEKYAAAAAAAGGGMTVIASGSLSGTGLDLNSIAGTYNHLQLVLLNPSFSADVANFTTQLNSITDYGYSQWAVGGNTVATRGYATDNNCQSTIATLQAAQTGAYWIFNFYNYADATAYHAFDIQTKHTSNSPIYYTVKTFGQTNTTAAITRIRVGMGGAITFSSGTYILYGVK